MGDNARVDQCFGTTEAEASQKGKRLIRENAAARPERHVAESQELGGKS